MLSPWAVLKAAVRKQGSSVWPHERTCQTRGANFGPRFPNGAEIAGTPLFVGSECAEFLQDSVMPIMRRHFENKRLRLK